MATYTGQTNPALANGNTYINCTFNADNSFGDRDTNGMRGPAFIIGTTTSISAQSMSGWIWIQCHDSIFTNCTFNGKVKVYGKRNKFNGGSTTATSLGQLAMKMSASGSYNSIRNMQIVGGEEETFGTETQESAYDYITPHVLSVSSDSITIDVSVYADIFHFDWVNNNHDVWDQITSLPYNTIEQTQTSNAIVNGTLDGNSTYDDLYGAVYSQDWTYDQIFAFYITNSPRNFVGSALFVIGGSGDGHWFEIIGQSLPSLTLDTGNYLDMADVNFPFGGVRGSEARPSLSCLLESGVVAFVGEIPMYNDLSYNTVVSAASICQSDLEDNFNGRHVGISIAGGLSTRVWGNTIIRNQADGYNTTPNIGTAQAHGSGSTGIQDWHIAGVTQYKTSHNSYRNNIIKGFRKQISIMTTGAQDLPSSSYSAYNIPSWYDPNWPPPKPPTMTGGLNSSLSRFIDVSDNIFTDIGNNDITPQKYCCQALGTKNLNWSNNIAVVGGNNITVTPTTVYDSIYLDNGFYPTMGILANAPWGVDVGTTFGTPIVVITPSGNLRPHGMNAHH